MTSRRAAEWDDDRLDAAFAARAAADRKAPGDLVAAVIDAVAARPRSIAGFRRSILAAAAAVILVVGLGGVAALTVLTRSGVAAIPSAAASELAHLGLQVLTVAEAARIRDAGTDDREIAVHGWFRQLPGPPGTPGPSCPPTLRVPVNPALPQRCGQTEQRIVAEPPDAGASIRPLFGMLDRTELMAAVSGNRAADVFVIGHFDDRRSVMCGAADVAECRDTFLVERIVSVDGMVLESSTGLSLERLEPGKVQPKWTAADVDRHVTSAAPGMTIAARLAIPGERVFEVEPALGTGSHGIIDRQLVWIVNGLEPRAGQPPRVRTFILVDNDPTTAFESVPYTTSNTGFAPIALNAGAPLPSTGDPFAGAPNEVAGLISGTVGMAVDRNFPGDGSELLVRGWYVPHDPLASCPGGLDQPIRPVLPPCNQGRNWLLDEPEALWSDPGKVDIDRQPTGAALNPVIPADVPFDVPRIWQSTSPTPFPVVVLGHFADPRVSAYAGDRYFVIDQLVWTGSTGAVPKSPVVRLTAGSTEAPEVVVERIEKELGPAITTWVSVMAPQDLAVLDPDAIVRAPELGEGRAVWVVRRLIDEPYDNLTRRLVAWSFTTDSGTRIWHGAGSRVDLATTSDVDPPGGDTRIVEVVDYSRRVLNVRAATDGDHFRWQPVGPEAAGWRLEIATGSTSRELAVRWHANRCQTDWELHVRVDGGFGPGPFVLPTTMGLEGCAEDSVARAVVLTFDRPIDLDTVTTSDNTSGG